LKLVVGLGNPGPEYARTRHNVGYMVADELARALGATFAAGKFAADVAEGRIGGEKVLIVKPRTFMNRSGEAVGPLLRFWKADLADLAVVHDDLELEPFRVQVKVGGGHGGHNGLKSLNAHVGGPDYARVRVGVGRPPAQMDPADYVLGRFGKGEEARLSECVEWATAAARAIVEVGAVKAMNLFNRREGRAKKEDD
jgi:PTH1 family peptidyl-tRNA hydrolase